MGEVKELMQDRKYTQSLHQEDTVFMQHLSESFYTLQGCWPHTPPEKLFRLTVMHPLSRADWIHSVPFSLPCVARWVLIWYFKPFATLCFSCLLERILTYKWWLICRSGPAVRFNCDHDIISANSSLIFQMQLVWTLLGLLLVTTLV